MSYIDFGGDGKYEVAILIKESVLNTSKIKEYYINHLQSSGIKPEDIIVIGLPYEGKDKVSVKFIKEKMEALAPHLKSMGVKNVMVADSKYFVRMAKLPKVAGSYGYRFNCVYEGWEDIFITVGLNYGSVIYNASNRKNLDIGLDALVDMHYGIYKDPGKGKIKVAKHLKTTDKIEEYLNTLLNEPRISCDIETFGLQFWNCGIGTIAFATDSENGVGFEIEHEYYFDRDPHRPRSVYLKEVLRKFFENYKGEIYYHNINFDVKVLVYNLFLQHIDGNLEDLYKEQLEAVDIMLRGAHCTKVLTYLATNNCAENKLDLKSNAQEAYGDWAEDIKNISVIPTEDLVKYNIGDACATLYLADKYIPKVKKDNQYNLYLNTFIPFFRECINAELNGMVLSKNTVIKNDAILGNEIENMLNKLNSLPFIQQYTHSLKIRRKLIDDSKLKTKERSLDELDHIEFNPGSSQQVAEIVYQLWGYPVEHKTDKGSPSTKGKVLKGLLAKIQEENNIDKNSIEEWSKKTNNKEIAERCQILDLIIQIGLYGKVKNTFFKAFLNSRVSGEYYYLHGNFNATGTKSGRLSSSDPNLQNIPSGSALAKLVKECFIAPKGWIMGGADFDSLEDRISALTTKDPNKIKVYTDGFDGHCLRAYSYFGDSMPDIDPNSVESINSIKKKYPDERQDSKVPTFLLTYQGTYIGMMEQCGFSKEKAQKIEHNYHALYAVSDAWVMEKLKEAAKVGYVEVAFGLRLRTPLLKEYKFAGDKSAIPPAAQKEMRTAGNALGQSYCMLNSRAAVEFMGRVRQSPYKHDIKLICMIHDAIYLLFKDDLDVVKFVNDNLPDCMAWQELPEIQHPEVKLSGELDLFYPNWNHAITLPNNASETKIKEIVSLAVA